MASFKCVFLIEKGEVIHFAAVDPVDYEWAMQWRWRIKRSKNGKKMYACRSVKVLDRHTSLYLHKEICLRNKGLPPSPSHIIVDHKNGDSLDCRRDNLRWATPIENRANYNGFYALQLRMIFKELGDVDDAKYCDRISRIHRARKGRDFADRCRGRAADVPRQSGPSPQPDPAVGCGDGHGDGEGARHTPGSNGGSEWRSHPGALPQRSGGVSRYHFAPDRGVLVCAGCD